MGGLSRIHYTAISRYARDHSITGADFDMIVAILQGMDVEYVAHVIAKQKPTTRQD